MGVAKYLCLETTQSQERESIQSSSLFFMKIGCHSRLSAHFFKSSLNSVDLMNHCSFCRNSSGVPQRQHVPTFCLILELDMKFPDVFRSSIIFFCASLIVRPAYFPAMSVSLPCSSMLLRNGRECLYIIFRSALSPTEHIISAPVPKSISTSSSAITWTSLPKIGNLTSFPTKLANLLSLGFTAIARQAGNSSGLVVEIMSSIPSPLNLMSFRETSLSS